MTFDGQYVWVANGGSGTVSKVLATTGAVTTYAVPGCANPESMAFDGTYVWLSCTGAQSSVFQLSSTGSVLYGLTMPLYAQGLAFDGTYIWAVSYSSTTGSLYRINASTGVWESFGSAPANLSDVAFDGTYIWVVSYNYVSKFVPGTGALVGTYSEPDAGGDENWGNGAIAFDGGNMWVPLSSLVTVAKF